MRRSRFGSIILGGALLLGASELGSGSASAESIGPAGGQLCQILSSPYSGEGCFIADGDDFVVSDAWKDGNRVVLSWQTDYGRSGECHNTKGSISSVLCDGVNLAEHRNIRVKVTTRDGASGADERSTGWSRWYPIG